MAVATRPEIGAPLAAPRERGLRHAVWTLLALAAAGVLLRALDSTGLPQLQNFFLIFSSLLIEAFPFIVLGAVVSAMIEVYVPPSLFARMARVPRGLQMPAAGLGGFAFPVCECGSVPVARRLVTKGLTPAAAITFMLAAPILNPVVLVATAIAYRGRDVLWPMVGGRAGLGLLAALAVGWVVGRQGKGELLRARPDDAAAGAGDLHIHGHGHAPEPRWRRFFGHLGDDFTMLGKYLVVGAAVAGVLQTFIPQDILASVADTPVVSILAMMVLAAVLSLCSESDAFVAASFVQFGMGSQLAFLVFGPMVDAKLGFLYAGTFSRRFLWIVVAGAGAVTLAGALWAEVMFG